MLSLPLTVWLNSTGTTATVALDSQLRVTAQGAFVTGWEVLRAEGSAQLSTSGASILPHHECSTMLRIYSPVNSVWWLIAGEGGATVAELDRGHYTFIARVSDCHFTNVTSWLHVSVLDPLPSVVNTAPRVWFSMPPNLWVAPKPAVGSGTSPYNATWIDDGEPPLWSKQSSSRSVHMEMEVLDDGLPLDPGELTVWWTTISGPDGTTFHNATLKEESLASVDAIFPAPATYVVRATISDGALTSFADLNVTVKPKRLLAYWPMGKLLIASVPVQTDE